jgi:hypothetical protein
MITAGTLDDKSLFKPQISIVCDSAHPWVPNGLPDGQRRRRQDGRQTVTEGGGWMVWAMVGMV